MGDLILGTPAIFSLKEKIKNCDIDIVVGDYNVELARQLGVFRNIYEYNFFKPKSSIDPDRRLIEEDTLVQSLPSYDFAIDLRRPPDTRFLLFRVKAALRAGFTTFSEQDTKLDICLGTDDVNYEFGKAKGHNLSSIALQFLALVDSLPIGSISIPPIRPGVEKNDTLALFPFAGQELKEWPFDNFVELSRQVLAERLFAKVNVYVTTRESERVTRLNQMDGVELHVGMSVDELINSVAANRAVVANNSFGAHLASLLGVPLIGIYSGHETWIEWQPVFGENTIVYSDLNCSPCHIGEVSQCPFDLLCLRQIRVEQVVDLLRQTRTGAQQAAARPFNYMPFAK